MGTGLLRVIVVLAVAAAAFMLGRWTGGTTDGTAQRPMEEAAPTEQAAPPVQEAPEPVVVDAQPVAVPEPPRADVLLAEIEEIASAAKEMTTPDARTYGFFEQLGADDLPGVTEFIEGLPAGNEQDALFTLAMKRWAQIDAPQALRRASAFPLLGTRVEARVAIYQEWATIDADAALVRAADETDEGALRRAVAAVLIGAATADPLDAFSLLEIAPVKFLDSPALLPTVERMVVAGYGTGKRNELQTVIDRMRPGDMRHVMIDTLARSWSAHFPSEAHAWVNRLVPEGETRDKIVQNLFTAIAFKDPSLAAEWVVHELRDPNRTKYLAAAVSQWAQLDLRGVEIWLNEQPEELSVDGGSLALADHFIKERRMTRAFSWIRRISQDEMRTKMFGDLGRIWSQERPAEFRRFLDETSLNRAEIELLTADVTPGS